MRKVKFKEWIPVKYIAEISHTVKDPNTGKWEDDFIHEGVFHQWGITYEEFASGAAPYTVGLIELEDGTMTEALPKNIKFLE